MSKLWFVADKDLGITGSDGFFGVVAKPPGVSIESKGSFLVNPDIICSFLTKSKSETIVIEKKNKNLFIKDDNAKVSINHDEDDVYPLVPEIPDRANAICYARELSYAFNKVSYCSNKKNDRNDPRSVNIEIVPGGKITVMALSDYQLAAIDVDFDADQLESKVGCAIDHFFIQKIDEVIKHNEGFVNIRVDGPVAWFILSDVILYVRRYDFRHKNWRNLLPGSEPASKVVVNAKEFIRAWDLVSVVTTKDYSSIRINVADDILVVSANVPESGISEVRVPCEVHGRGLEVHTDAKMFSKALHSLENNEELTINFHGPKGPIVIKESEGHVCMEVPSV